MTNLKKNYGVISQLHSMLTNNPERPKFKLNAFLEDSEGKIIDSDKFDIYANDPISKIEEKVEKLRTEGNMTTLRIIEMSYCRSEECTVYLKI